MKTTLRKIANALADYAENNVIIHFNPTGATRAATKFVILAARISPKFAIDVLSKYHKLVKAFFDAMGSDNVDREIEVDERVLQEFVGTDGYEMRIPDGDKCVNFRFKIEDINKLITVLRNK